VLALAPDASSSSAADKSANAARWAETGCDARAVWGECKGSGAKPYRVCADLSGPAFRCTCPSRKVPCKHVLGLLLLWSDGTVPEAPGPIPSWAGEWLAGRRAGAERQTRRSEQANGSPKAPDPKTAARREQRVTDGLDELDRWLRDQVTYGLAGAEKASYRLWDDAARRLIDAQASGPAGQLRSLAALPSRHIGWPERLLSEYALLRLLTQAYRRRDDLPEPLRQTVRARIGFTVAQDEVLRGDIGEQVHDRWYVAGQVDTERDFLITRRIWLRGRRTGRSALILSFAAPGRSFDTSLVVGGTIDADLAFYPGAQPLRALVAEQYGPVTHKPPTGTTLDGLLREYAAALSRDPWLDRWPAVLSGVRPARGAGPGPDGDTRYGERWHLIDDDGAAIPLDLTDPWRLLAVSGGAPMTVAGEWTPRGMFPLSGWHADEGPVAL
jgi:hypothetical protein